MRYPQPTQIAPVGKIAPLGCVFRAILLVRLFCHSVISWVDSVNLVSICGKAPERGGSQRSGPETESYLFAPPPDLVLSSVATSSNPAPAPRPSSPFGNHYSNPALSFLIIKRRRSPTFSLRLTAVPWDQPVGGPWKKRALGGRGGGRLMVVSQVHELDKLS